MKNLLIAVLLIISVLAWGEIHVAASASRADVLTAYNLCSNGDTLQIPAGAATWTSTITMAKAINIEGAGKTSTVITGYGFIIPNGTDDWRITAIGWTNVASVQWCIQVGSNYLEGCHNWRIDNLRILNYARSLTIQGHSSGCVDNCEFYGTRSDGIQLWGERATAWTKAANFGSDDFVFFEDNDFDTYNQGTGVHVIQAEQGARWVFRYNTVTETGYDITGWVDNHGYGHGTNYRGGRAFEIYSNNFVKGTTGWARAIRIRGGTGLIYDNVFDQAVDTFSPCIEFTEYRVAKYGGCFAGGECSASLYCPIADGGEGYPCCDQIGRGANQTDEPLYVWDNVDHNANPVGVTVDTTNGVNTYIVVDRDYYLSSPGGYVPYTYPHPLRGAVIPPSAIYGNWVMVLSQLLVALFSSGLLVVGLRLMES